MSQCLSPASASAGPPTGLAAQAETGQPTASGPRRPHSRPAPARRTDPGPPLGDAHAAPTTTPRMELRLPGAGGAKARRTHPRCGRGEHHRRKGRCEKRPWRPPPPAPPTGSWLQSVCSAPDPPQQSFRPCVGGPAVSFSASLALHHQPDPAHLGDGGSMRRVKEPRAACPLSDLKALSRHCGRCSQSIGEMSQT